MGMRMGRTGWVQVLLRGTIAAGFIFFAGQVGQAQTVRMQPPPPVAEHPDRMPGRGYAWVPGYQRWDGRSFHWEHGRWALPPRPGAQWMPGRWVQGRDGWRWLPGHWRA